MTQLDVRPGRLDLLFRPGNAITLELTWPVGALVGRTFGAFLGAQPLSVSIVGDLMTVVASDSITEDFTSSTAWTLVENDDVVMTGHCAPSFTGTIPVHAATVLLEETSVSVLVGGPPGPAGDDGASGPQNLYIQDTAPVAPPIPYLWVQTDYQVDGGVTLWYDDGEP